MHTGEWRVGAPHGTGRFVYASGDVFEGELSLSVCRARAQSTTAGASAARRWAESSNDYDGEWQMDARNFPLLSPLSRREVAAKPVKRAAFAEMVS